MPINADQQANLLKTVVGLFNAAPGHEFLVGMSQTNGSGSSTEGNAIGFTKYTYDNAGALVSVTGPSATTAATTLDGSTAPDDVLEFGPLDEVAPEGGTFELDLPIHYTDGPVDSKVPDTVHFEVAATHDSNPTSDGLAAGDANSLGLTAGMAKADNLKFDFGAADGETEGFPNGRRPGDDIPGTADLTEDTFVFEDLDISIMLDILFVPPTAELYGTDETYPHDLSNGVTPTIPEPILSDFFVDLSF